MSEYYRHFKGGVYRIVSIAKDSGSEGKVVVYQAMYGDGDIWTRPYDEFFGEVERDGRILARFTEISEEEAVTDAPVYLKPWYHFPDIRLLPRINPESEFSWGVKAMITLLQRRGLVADSLFEGLLNEDDIREEIKARIRAYEPGEDPESIFHLIQTWGGSTGICRLRQYCM